MTEKVIEKFEVKYLQVVDEAGNADPAVFPAVQDETIKKFFETIILVRAYNDRAISLQREGRLGTYASIYGQEASQVGSALALGKDDWVFPSFRESGVFLSLGYPLWQMLRYWKGDERGMKIPKELNILPMSVPVGTHIPHATGAAWAMKIKGHKNAAVCYFGDGGSSRGDSHKGFNMAGVLKAYRLTETMFSASTRRQKTRLKRQKKGRGRPLLNVLHTGSMTTRPRTMPRVTEAKKR